MMFGRTTQAENMQVLCGCRPVVHDVPLFQPPTYLPLVSMRSHTIVLTTTSRTVLTQNYVNDSDDSILECQYDFPLYDGVSVVGFSCQIGSRIIKGAVQEKEKARAIYEHAVAQGETAGLLAQGPTADVFTTRLGNIPARETVTVIVTYIGELKHDVGAESIRFTIPTNIAPRYGSPIRRWDEGHTLSRNFDARAKARGDAISITVDIDMLQGSFIRELRSPSHPIAVTLGNISGASSAEDPKASQASASLSQNSTALDRDFVLEIHNKASTSPTAVLEEHLDNPQDRALMVSLVPSFRLPPAKPEVILVADRSGSMGGKIPTLVSALKIFLRSLPVGIHFNICSFGSHHSFLWASSREYNERSLDEATHHVETFSANYGGTETLAAVRAAIERRNLEQDLALILCTDGDIWQQEELFTYLNRSLQQSEKQIRVFPLGIGNSVSSGLIEGVARAGKGFASAVAENEKMDAKVVRVLKGALTENVTDWNIEVKFKQEDQDDDDFVLVERVTDSLDALLLNDTNAETAASDFRKAGNIDSSQVGPNRGDVQMSDGDDNKDVNAEPGRPDGPMVSVPKLLQTPQDIPPLYPSARITVYLLMSPEVPHQKPAAVVIQANSSQGPLEISIPVENLPQPGETIHQLAARRAVGELEEGRGWLSIAKDKDGTSLKTKYSYMTDEAKPQGKESQFQKLVEHEAVRLGVQYQVGGKWCSFLAVEGNKQTVQVGNSYAPVHDLHRTGSLFGAPVSMRQAQMMSYAPLSSSSLNTFDVPAGSCAAMRAAPSVQISAQSPSLGAGTTSAILAQGAPTSRSQHRLSRNASPMSRGAPGGLFSSSTFGGNSGFGGMTEMSAPAQNLFSSTGRGENVSSLFSSSSSVAPNSPTSEAFGQKRMASRSQAPVPREASFDGLGSSNDQAPTRGVGKLEPHSLYQVISLQRFQGCWEFDQVLLAACGVAESSNARRMLADSSSQVPPRKTVWATMLAIVFLERKMAAEEDAWELVVNKAKDFLQHSGVDMHVEMGKSPLKELLEEL